LVAVNFARNARLAACWKKGMTIEQAAEATDTPPSTTGYYYKKFDRYARKGIPFPVSHGVDDESMRKRRRELNQKRELKTQVDELKKQEKFAEAMQLIELDSKEEKAGLHRNLTKEKLALDRDLIIMGILKDETKNMSSWRLDVINGRVFPSRDNDTFDSLLVNFLKRIGGKVTIGEFQFQLGERAVALRTRGGHTLSLSKYAERFGIQPSSLKMHDILEAEKYKVQDQDSSNKSESS
jgi:hypothetical protein